MRITGLIFSFYIIMLAIVPCCTIDSCPADKTNQATNHEKNDDDCGACSPFFSCMSCATATIASEPPRFEFSSIPQLPVYSVCAEPSLSEQGYDFWQPPKLA